jgi:hypothetical protein
MSEGMEGIIPEDIGEVIPPADSSEPTDTSTDGETPSNLPPEDPSKASASVDLDDDIPLSKIEDKESERIRNAQLLNETGGTMIFAEISPLMEELKGKSPDEISTFLRTNPEKRKLYEVGLILTYQGEDKFRLSGNQLTIGENTSISKIKGVAEDNSLICEVIKDGQVITQNIPRKEVMFLQIISERAVIAAALPAEAQELFNMYVDSLQNGVENMEFGENFASALEGAQNAYAEKAAGLAEGDPAKQAILELLKDPQMNLDAILEASVKDPAEKARLKKLIESGNMNLGLGLLLLLVVAGFQAASEMTK